MAALGWKSKEGIVLEKETKVHALPDWQSKPDLSSLQKEIKTSLVSLSSNSTFYSVGKEIRYIRKAGDDHQIAAIDHDPIILAILGYCSTPKTLKQLVELIIGFDEQTLCGYIRDLLVLQLLLSSKHPNILGSDYFSRIGHLPNQKDKQYFISERKPVMGEFDQRIFRHLPDLVKLLQKVIDLDENLQLNEFKDRFVRKFEQAEIPIMIALDPETGVGYGGLETYYNETPITTLFEESDKQANRTIINHNNLREELYKQILDKSFNGSSINPEELVTPAPVTPLLPNSFNALCTLVDGNIFLNSLGGTTATALFGRFALAVEDIHKHCKEIADLEQQSNPEVFLFDIGYTKEDGVDNINRRPSIYDYQLNILNFDTSEIPLSANDILISIQKGKVLLRSKSLGKRLVPRFASAYNYMRSDLPLFRLLMDIQSQGIQTNLMFRPNVLIPMLHYYPRVQFRNIIISPAMWLLEKSVIKGINLWQEQCNALARHLRSTLTCDYVKTGIADQMLFLDTRNNDDIEILLSLLEKVDYLYLEEAYLPKDAVVPRA